MRKLLTVIFILSIKKCVFWVLLSIAVGLIVALVYVTQASAGQVTLAWDPNNPTQDGYRVYQRIEDGTYDYTKPAWPTDGQNHTETTCTISGLAEGQTYYFVVRAYIGADESGDSNEVDFKAPVFAPSTVSSSHGKAQTNSSYGKVTIGQ